MRTHVKKIAFLLLSLFLFQLVWPAAAWALTGGPSQPEVQSFEPVGTSDMVDLFTGDFNYNIPLLDVEGYPINISYHAGVSMDQEASWVGLGWNINPGVINRNMRGLPDDFNGDKIKKVQHIKDDKTYGMTMGAGLQIFGKKKFPLDPQKTRLSLGASFGIFSNTYRGIGHEFNVNPAFSAGGHIKGNLGLGLGYNSQSGLGVNPSCGLTLTLKQKTNKDYQGAGSIGLGVAASYNSRAGLQTLSVKGSGGYSVETPSKLEGETNSSSLSFFGNNGGAVINFATSTYTPPVNMPLANESYSFSGTVGGELWGVHPNASIRGYYSKQSVADTSLEKSAYGYMFTQVPAGDNDVLLDFNREKDVPFIKESSKNLALANYSYDVYNLSGQGIGGTYRPYRSDMSVLHDDWQMNTSKSGRGGLELGLGTYFHAGADVTVNHTYMIGHKWDLGDGVKPIFSGNKSVDYDPFYEAAYFKNAGEKTPTDVDYYNKYGYDKTVRVGFNADKDVYFNKTLAVDDKIYGKSSIAYGGANNYYFKTKRDKRNQNIVSLDAEQAKDQALDHFVKNYAMNTPVGRTGVFSSTNINRYSTLAGGKRHISEITATNPDGSRYVYGIPAYNNKQMDVTFSVYDPAVDEQSGQIQYDPGVNDNTVSNTRGTDNYFSKTETPAYAHSYLLTAILSADYADVTGDGITDDDLGTAIKINYTRVEENYRWRVPYRQYQAAGDKGLLSDPGDAKGNYSYGKKSVWLISSIVSKNYIAEFNLSARDDGFGVVGENGGMDLGQPSYKLDYIALYAKQDRIRNQNNAVPIKEVLFTYDYSLCRNVENNVNYGITASYGSSGKLTLKSIYFLYGKSQKGRLSPYEFTYSSTNPDYNLKGYDRWGNYKPNRSDSGNILNANFPYVEQGNRSTKSDRYAQAWTLTQVKLPSGGAIKMQYEADDYAYVQNKRAMQMFRLEGFGNSGDYSAKSDLLYDKATDQEYNYIFFKLSEPLTGTGAVDKLFHNYVEGIGDLFFNCFIDVTGKGNYEWVKGYSELDYNDSSPPYGIATSAPTAGSIGWVRVRNVRIGDSDDKGRMVNPIARTGWQFARLQMSHLIYNGSAPTGTGNNDFKKMMGSWGEIKARFIGYNALLRLRKYAYRADSPKSWIRLDNPNGKKVGGGLRVKRLELVDNWATMGAANAGAADFSYGQEYSYTTNQTQPDGSVKEISSGVASYEPMIGNEENPWRLPVSYQKENKLAPDDKYYTETPYGESYFPAPCVGYSKVTVSGLRYTDVTRHATGYTVSEFYTAKDFPTIIDETQIFAAPTRVTDAASVLSRLLGMSLQDEMTASQGYKIELNDMHGKPRGQKVYEEGEKNELRFKSGVEYFYKTDSSYNRSDKEKGFRLDNTVKLIHPDNTITDGTVGVDIDVCTDLRNEATESWNIGADINVDGFPTPFPAVIPILLPISNTESTNFNSAVITKVVHKFGILEKTVAYQDGARITTENLGYDAETGEVLLTKTQNEFQDPIYQFQYPAHWAYDGMGPAYKNAGAILTHAIISSKVLRLPNYPGLTAWDIFTPGDEVRVVDHNSAGESFPFTDKLWVIKTDDGDINFIKKDGKPMVGWSRNASIEILRSGRRNMQTIPIGTVTSLQNPIKLVSGTYVLSFTDATQVINAGATEFSQFWASDCDGDNREVCRHVSKYVTDAIKVIIEVAEDNAYADVTNVTANTLDSYNNSDTLKDIMEVGSTSCPGDVTFQIVHNTDSLEYPIGYAEGYNFNSHKGTTDGCVRCSFSFMMFDHPQLDANDIVNIINPRFSGIGNSYTATAIFSDGSKHVINLSFEVCGSPLGCITECTVLPGDIVNPFIHGLQGNWRKKRDFVYLDNRKYTTPLNVRKDGTYTTFNPYWEYSSLAGWHPGTNPNWTWSSEVTKYSRTGQELENRDALNRYSSVVLGYNNTIPIAVAANAKYQQIAYDGFEDHKYAHASDCKLFHWKFEDQGHTGIALDSFTKHTGRHSLALNAGKSITVGNEIIDCSKDTNSYADYVGYQIKPCDCIGRFSPDTGNYVIGGWLKVDTTATASTYQSPSIVVALDNGSITNHAFKASGPIVEGWQRVEGEFRITSGTIGISVILVGSTANKTWFDDIRVHPFNSTLKTYAYDERSLKLLGELDENNYATFYEYNDQGELTRIKKETINGIVTLKESRNSTLKR